MSDSMRSEPESMRVSISTRCPACGRQTLFVGSGGHLTCAFITCRNPSVEDAIERLQRIEGALGHFVDNADGYDKSLVRVVVEALKMPDFYALDYLRDELTRLEHWGRRLIAEPMSESRQADDAVARCHGEGQSGPRATASDALSVLDGTRGAQEKA